MLRAKASGEWREGSLGCPRARQRPRSSAPHLMGSACGRSCLTGLSAATTARILTMGAGQESWPLAARGIRPPMARPQALVQPPLPGAPAAGCRRPELPLLPPEDTPGLPPLAAPGRPLLPLPPLVLLLPVVPARLLPGSAGLRCCCCCLARGGRLNSCPGSGCRRRTGRSIVLRQQPGRVPMCQLP